MSNPVAMSVAATATDRVAVAVTATAPTIALHAESAELVLTVDPVVVTTVATVEVG